MMTISRVAGILGLVVGLGLVSVAAVADGGGGGWSSPGPAADPNYTSAVKAVEAGQYKSAIVFLEKVVATSPEDPDALNYLGFSHRKLGEFQKSLGYYTKALAIEPDHRGANEYLGELYLQMGDLPKAEDRLKKLDSLCFFGCEEFDDLKKAIAAYKARSS